MVVGNLAILIALAILCGLVLVGTYVTYRHQRYATQAVMIHVAVWLLWDERRRAAGEYPRPIDEIDTQLTRWTTKLSQIESGNFDQPIGG